MKPTTRLLLTLALLILLQHPTQGIGMSYSVKGDSSYQVFVSQAHGEPLKRELLLRKFEVLVDESTWKIRVELVGDTNFDCIIDSYDGTNLFHYAVPSKDTVEAFFMIGATVEASPVPARITSAAGEYPWLAFASGCYFRSHTNHRALALEQARSKGFTRRYEVPCRVALSSSPPYLPTAIEYISTNLVVMVQSDGTLGFEPLPPFLSKGGYRSGVFESGGFTNVQGLSFPTKFEYRGYRPRPHTRTTNDLNCVVVVRGEVTSISARRQRVDCALPDRPFMLEDQRVPKAGVLYRVDHGRIPPVDGGVVNDAREQARLRRIVQPRE